MPTEPILTQDNWKDMLADGALQLGISLDDRQQAKLYHHAEALRFWNRKTNLTAVTDPMEMLVKHYLDSISAVSFVPPDCSVIDIGTGAGFPGIVLNIVRPDLRILLVDAARKKIAFNRQMIRELELKAVDAVHCRIESLHGSPEVPHRFDVAICRAYTSLLRFVGQALPLIPAHGRLIAMKSRHVDEEAESLKEMRYSAPDGTEFNGDELDVGVHDFRLPYLNSIRKIVVIKKQSFSNRKNHVI